MLANIEKSVNKEVKIFLFKMIMIWDDFSN